MEWAECAATLRFGAVTVNWSITSRIENPVNANTKNQKPLEHLVPAAREPLSEVRDAVNALASVRRELASNSDARPLRNKDIRDAIQKGRR